MRSSGSNRNIGRIALTHALALCVACAAPQSVSPQRSSETMQASARATTPPGMAGVLSPSGIAALQRGLNRHGHSLEVNARFDAQTERALRAYQRAHELAATGMPDMATLESLGLEPRNVYAR